MINKFFDYAASTPVSDSVLEAMLPWMQLSFANPSSAHIEGEKSARAIYFARETIAKKIGAMPSEVIFTSGATEANNLAIKGVAFRNLEKKGHIITSVIEHKCILTICFYLESIGFEVTYLTPDNDGLISPLQLKSAIKSNTILISIHHANNEIGTIQPIEEYGEIAADHNIPFHTDAAQSFCKIDIDVLDMDIDMLSLSGHKIYGPKGIGALYIKNSRNSNIIPLVHGGGQELGLRGGTSPTSLIVGLASAVSNFPVQSNPFYSHVKKSLSKFNHIRNGGTNTLPNLLSITFANETEVTRFQNEYRWFISQGSACNSFSNTPSHVLTAIGLSDDESRRTFRISTPPYKIPCRDFDL